MAQMVRPLEKPVVEQHCVGADEMQGRCSSPVTPSFVRSYDQEDDSSHHGKKSVLTKVKEKAKKWRNTLSKKKHGNEENGTPAWGVTLEEEEEEDPEYHGAPMYESELAPEDYKETAMQHSAPTPIIADKYVLVAKNMGKNESKTLTESVTDMLAPAYAMASEATQMIAAKIQSLPVVAMGATREESRSEKNWDKGVSVKEYLKQKLEPGAEERALSEVISQVMNPRKSGDNGEIGVVEKVKEAVSSLLGKEEQSSKATVTINPQEIIEEDQERRLQSN